jgi:hypothetical protein
MMGILQGVGGRLAAELVATYLPLPGLTTQVRRRIPPHWLELNRPSAGWYWQAGFDIAAPGAQSCACDHYLGKGAIGLTSAKP